MIGGELYRIISNSFRRSNVEKKKKKDEKQKEKRNLRDKKLFQFFPPPARYKIFPNNYNY